MEERDQCRDHVREWLGANCPDSQRKPPSPGEQYWGGRNGVFPSEDARLWFERMREKRGINDIYLLRVEQLYPFPAKALITELSRFRNAEMVWCQEEPKNMGAWSFIDPYLEWVLAHIDAKHQRVRYTGRPAAASPATGLMSKHLAQLAAFLEDALGE